MWLHSQYIDEEWLGWQHTTYPQMQPIWNVMPYLKKETIGYSNKHVKHSKKEGERVSRAAATCLAEIQRSRRPPPHTSTVQLVATSPAQPVASTGTRLLRVHPSLPDEKRTGVLLLAVQGWRRQATHPHRCEKTELFLQPGVWMRDYR